MFRWTIVQEANRKKKDKDTEIDEDQIAKKGEEVDDDLEADDYTEEEVDLDDEDLEADDYTEDDEDTETEDYTEDDVDDEEETDEDVTEDEEANGVEDNIDETGDESTDYTEETSDESDSTLSSTTPEPSNTGSPNDMRNTSLINDYITLYDAIKGIITKVNSMNKTDILRNKIIIQVSKNLNILLNTLHKYIIKSFDKNSYVFNLYQFNLFIHAVNVNIEMIKKNNELVSKE